MIINPRNFGASPELADNAANSPELANNTAALQASLDAVKPGDIWVLDPGVWCFDGRGTGLQLPKEWVAVGSGGSVSILKAMPDDPVASPGQVKALYHDGGRVEMTGIGLVGPGSPSFDGWDRRDPNRDKSQRGQYSSAGLWSLGRGEIVLTACAISQFRNAVWVNNQKYPDDGCPTSIVGCTMTAWETGVLYRPHGGDLKVIGSHICVDDTKHTGEQPGHALYVNQDRSFTVTGGELVGPQGRPEDTNGFKALAPGWAGQHYPGSGNGTATYRGVLFSGPRGVLASDSGFTVLESCRFETTEIGLRPGLHTTTEGCLFDITADSGRWVVAKNALYRLVINGGTWRYSGATRPPLLHLIECGRVDIHDAELIGGAGAAIYVDHDSATVEVHSGSIGGEWYAAYVKAGRGTLRQGVEVVGPAESTGEGVLTNQTDNIGT